MNKIKKCTQILSILAILGFTVLSCEQTDEAVGYGLLNSGEANGLRRFIDVLSYNLYNGDTLRSDESRLPNAVIGVYEEPIFGKVRASYVTQVRMPINNAIFSDSIENGLPKASVDSVIFYLAPFVDTDEEAVDVDTIKVDENGIAYDRDTEDNIDTFRIVSKYPITQKYGNAMPTMNVEVHTINEFLKSIDSTYYSNEIITNNQYLGGTTIGEFLTGVQFKNSQGAVLDSINGEEVSDITPSVKIYLDNDFFQNNIINQQGSNNLNDPSRFIQYLKGLKLSTPDNNAFLLRLAPTNLQCRMYYSYTNKRDSEGSISSGENSLLFSLNNTYNVRIGLYERDANQSSYLSPFVGNSNSVTGDDVLYLDGLGGFKTIVQFNEAQLEQLRTDFVNNNIGIVGASLKFYKHPLTMDFADPPHIFAYVYKNLELPQNVSDLVYDDFEFINDIFAFSQIPGYSFNPAYDSSLGYYQINVTDYVKGIIEKDSMNYPLIVEMGNFEQNQFGQVVGINNTNKAYNPYRMAFKGNTYGDDENLKLEILYTEN